MVQAPNPKCPRFTNSPHHGLPSFELIHHNPYIPPSKHAEIKTGNSLLKQGQETSSHLQTTTQQIMATAQTQLRSLYRRVLRELPSPSKPHTILSHPSQLKLQVRASILSPSQTTATPKSALTAAAVSDPTSASSEFTIHTKKTTEQRIQESEQFVQYVQAQRQYLSLLERYNPGMNMTEEERTRLTARRVGMDLPVDEFGNVL